MNYSSIILGLSKNVSFIRSRLQASPGSIAGVRPCFTRRTCRFKATWATCQMPGKIHGIFHGWFQWLIVVNHCLSMTSEVDNHGYSWFSQWLKMVQTTQDYKRSIAPWLLVNFALNGRPYFCFFPDSRICIGLYSPWTIVLCLINPSSPYLGGRNMLNLTMKHCEKMLKFDHELAMKHVI